MNLRYCAFFALLLTSSLGTAADADIIYVKSGTYVAGAAAVRSTQGGEYVYGTELSDGRPAQRFMLGKPPRQSYDFFSAQEEAALWHMRQNQLAALNQVPARSTRHHARPHRVLNWPKVVVAGQRICVPRLPFAAATDWREHLVCWNQEASRVE
ncbi:hypothetical protein [Ralstonia pseudosolanacearum]|uniref:hypothetical protein n=1 Tax=Ralstonia pseudosolanacearum TaxID=1310165 RepID=UPI0011CE6BBC|nr:hypothetical protein [Ralstonia pseudosolanacearum]